MATMLGVSTVDGAVVNANSSNPVAARGFPIGNLWDNPPQTGFQWYDTWTMTFLNNITFVNFRARPSMGYFAPTIFWTITWCVEGVFDPHRHRFVEERNRGIVRGRLLLQV